MKLHIILIGMVFVGLVATGLVNFISAGVNTMNDSSSSGFQSSTLVNLDQNAENIDNYNSFLNNQTASADPDNRNDILGALFGRGYQQARGPGISNNINLYQGLINDSVNEITILGGFRTNIIIAVTAAIVIAFGVGILLYFIIGKERV